MTMRDRFQHPPLALLRGAALLSFTAIAWGGMLHVAKPMLVTLDPFWLNGIRYAIAAPLFAAILVLVEGRRALSFEGQALRAAVLGTVGFAGFGIVALLGVRGTRPEYAALILAMMPMITALIGWLRGLARPSAFASFCMVLGLAGVLLTASQGSPSRILEGSVGSAEALVFAGVACWAIYTQGIPRFSSWSPLRITALTSLASLPGFAGLVALATWSGLVTTPDAEVLVETGWGMAYIIAVATILAMLAWNAGIKRLGPLNGVLFINLVPVSAFAIGIAFGRRFSSSELIGAALVILSLVASNAYARARQRKQMAIEMNAGNAACPPEHDRAALEKKA